MVLEYQMVSNEYHINQGLIPAVTAIVGGHHAPRHLVVGQLCTSELEGEPQQGGGQGSLGLRGEGGGAADPGVGPLLLGDGGEVAQQQQVLVVGHLLVGCVHPWAQLQLLLRLGEQVQGEVSGVQR